MMQKKYQEMSKDELVRELERRDRESSNVYIARLTRVMLDEHERVNRLLRKILQETEGEKPE